MYMAIVTHKTPVAVNHFAITSIYVQGVPADYFGRNEEYVQASKHAPRRQSIEEIDSLLWEAAQPLTPGTNSNEQSIIQPDYGNLAHQIEY